MHHCQITGMLECRIYDLAYSKAHSFVSQGITDHMTPLTFPSSFKNEMWYFFRQFFI